MEPKKKNLAVRFLDAVIFGRSKYLDRFGNNPLAGRLTNYFNQPKHSGTAIGMLWGMLHNYSNDRPVVSLLLLTPLLISAGLDGLSFLAKKYMRHSSDSLIQDIHLLFFQSSSAPDYYFDTKPERNVPIPPLVLAELKTEKYTGAFYMGISAVAGVTLLTVSAGSATIYGVSMDGNREIAMKIMSQVITPLAGYMTMAGIPRLWRSTRALNGEWAVLTSKPEKETARQAAPAVQLS